MQIKRELRKELIAKRRAVTNKAQKNEAIVNNLLNSEYYRSADTILCFASTEDEINTDAIINSAICDGKTLALPYCTDKSGHMQFYIITSPADLTKGSFGIREPDITKCKRLESYDNSIIIVPALAYAKDGFRIGYGGGYYDRFLTEYNGVCVGICYDEMLLDKIPADSYDLPVDIIVTQNLIHIVSGG